jgi:glycosyltransferase XagB
VIPSESVVERAFARFPQPDESERRAALEYALFGLERRHPGRTARETFARWQSTALAIVVVLLAAGFAIVPARTAGVLSTVLVLFYAASMFERSIIFARGLRAGEAERPVVPPRLSDEDLPRYTILMPAYDEPEVIKSLVRATTSIDYPEDKLELLLLLEEDDERTLGVLLEEELPRQVRVLLVPPSEPRTKPKACNFGLYFASSEFVTIYDAEDRPYPQQLREAAAKFRAGPDDVVCLQARLDYYNSTQNVLTRWFTVEYATWFGMFLPGLDALGLPIPLGGTSNHIRTDVLRDSGAWDAYNVTEDADLGLRLAREGLKTGVLDSITDEEANSDMVNWIRQRSRWYKGYLQTWLVHFRDPRAAISDFGLHGALSVTLLIGATPVLAATNLLAWICTAIFIIGVPVRFIALFPWPTVYLGLFMTLFGNAATVYLSVITMTQTKNSRFAWISLAYPIYWILMALAATKALWQLFARPSYWEKTAHGLDAEPALDG